MKDELKKYIEDNRELFDEDFNDQPVWRKIEENLIKKEKKGLIRYQRVNYWKAAVFILLGTVSILLLERAYNGNVQEQAQENDPAEIEQVENYYLPLIQKKRSDLISGSGERINDILINEVQTLDSAYQFLKKEYEKTGDEKVLNALILNLQTRIEILNHQENILQELKNLQKNGTQQSI
jgi:hypothetical protein